MTAWKSAALLALSTPALGGSIFRSMQEESGSSGPAYDHGIECTPCPGSTYDCEVKVTVNFFAGETGMSKTVKKHSHPHGLNISLWTLIHTGLFLTNYQRLL
jgi:hypothetical protein